MLCQHCSGHPRNCLCDFEQTVVDDEPLRVWELGEPNAYQLKNLLSLHANIRRANLLWIPNDEDLSGTEQNGQGTNVALAGFIYDNEIKELCQPFSPPNCPTTPAAGFFAGGLLSWQLGSNQ